MTVGRSVPLMPMTAVIPVVPVSSCPAKRNCTDRTDAPPCAAAVAAYRIRLTPCTHSPQLSAAVPSFTTSVVSAAVGRMVSGTYAVNAALRLPTGVPPLYTFTVTVPVPCVVSGSSPASDSGTVH